MRKLFEVIFNLVFWLIITYLFYSDFTTRLGENFKGHFGIIHFPFIGTIHIPQMTYALFYTILGPIIIFYLFYLIFIPKFLVRRRYFLFTIIGLLSCILVGYEFRLVVGGYSFDTKIKVLVYFTILALVWGIIGSAIKGIFLWVDSIAERRVLEKKHLESKNALLMLQAQINPHFLFNSLNNIDILIEETPKIASEYLKKLSDILRYVLYETKEEETDLSKEIVQIQSYIDLQRIRTNNPKYVNLNIIGQVVDQKIAPMIFIPFVENAFKHSKNKTIDNAIDIQFEISDKNVIMVCKNYFEPNQIEVIKSEGLGNETIKQRLNLLYPNRHKLVIDKTEHWFIVTLSIDFKDGN
jgi:two-component system, LytTR family, sensor kinase